MTILFSSCAYSSVHVLSRLQVLVIRANDLTEVDGALSLLNLDTLAKQSDAIG